MRITDYDVCRDFAAAMGVEFSVMRSLLDGQADALPELAARLAAATRSVHATLWSANGAMNGPLRLISVKVWAAMKRRGELRHEPGQPEERRGGCANCD
jgi:hypothetical protein